MLTAPSPGSRAEATHGVLRFPSEGRWEVLAGYNTATHTGEDPYALDLWRLDAATGGSKLLSPVSGRIRFAGGDCIGIEDDHDATIHICHVFPASGLDRRDYVEAGQVIGSVAPDGLAGNNGVAHIHIAVFVNGRTVPFTGAYALEGVEFAATSAFNAHYGRVITSGAVATGGTTSNSIAVDVGEDLEVDPGATVTLTAQVGGATDILEYEWHQVSGPTVDFSDSGRSISFIAPDDPGTALIFRVIAVSTFQRTGTDSIVVAVGADGESPAPAPSGGSGEIVGGSVPSSGFGLIVFGGGSSQELIAAAGCPVSAARFWATSGGGFLVYIPGTQVAAVNAAWESRFASGIPELTPLLARCA